MKLEGSLDAFSLPDIFQLLSFTKKTGGLHLACDGCDGVVFFSGGLITGASADSSRQPLARRLIGAGAVDDEALSAAVAAAAEGTDLGVARALLDQGALDGGLLQQAATDQAVDAVFDLLTWQRGDFVFVVDEVNPDDVGVQLSADAVLGDADARRDTWEQVSGVLPSGRAVLAMPVVLPADPQVSREEWSLLALVDGRRTVAELVDLTGSGQYAVVSTLAGLVGRGLLEARVTDQDASADDHVGVVVRRQALLGPLETTPFVPVVEATVEVALPLSAADDDSAGDAGRTAESPVEDGTPEVPEPAEPAEAHEAHEAHEPDESDESDEAHEAHEDGADERWHTAGDPADVPAADVQVPAPAAAADDRQPVGAGASEMLGGAHVPGDVVPPRPEPFLPKRQADFDETADGSTRPVLAGAATDAPGPGTGGQVIGATAVALDPSASPLIERDPNVNRSLMLRLIAGVRGL